MKIGSKSYAQLCKMRAERFSKIASLRKKLADAELAVATCLDEYYKLDNEITQRAKAAAKAQWGE